MLEKKSEFTIYPITVLQDNIVWVWVHNCNAVVVDPSISGPVEKWLLEKNLSLKAILQTHHHDDHIGGTQKLIKTWPEAKVVASKKEHKRIPFQTFSVDDNDIFNLMDAEIKVIEVHGHTDNHIAFYISKQNAKCNILLPGDTLFGGGSGRLLEGSPVQMFESLSKLNSHLNLNRNEFSFPFLFRLPGRMNHTKKKSRNGQSKNCESCFHVPKSN